MIERRVVLRARARQDIEQAIAFYLDSGSERAALDFVDQLERALRSLARYPDSGSTRYAVELGLSGVRTELLAGLPYCIFYRAEATDIDVWRVLHQARDIPPGLRREE